ncbi:hypothetical protein NDU88_002371 [Pleurodeles waltl]|uniref:Ig-like domain-containing protein n=1 Tax=Pleurodeles waltl TaxID=8319 RepID=A0AAV7TKJ8_PLEWA|nr:hypothetical protein NDU88_002371 [Pleurodeles waltl]
MARLLESLLRGHRGTVTLKPLTLCYLAFCLLSAESQELKILDAEPIKALVNESVTISCMFGARVWDLKIIGIIWYYSLKNGEKAIYQFDGERGMHKATRPGSTMLIEEIRNGNGALHLPHIQFNEEGEYKCVVFVTPSKAEGKFLLEVSAQPVTSLSSKEVEVEIGTEKSVSCLMEGFYPQAFEISWWTSKYGVISKDTCTAYPEKNHDGTYNVISHLRLQPSIEDNKNVYTCIVHHRSLPGPLRLNTTLTVKEKDDSLHVLIGAVVGTIALCILIVIGSLCLHKRWLKIAAPKVTEITGNDVLVHMEPTTLSCQITGFRPANITVAFSFVQREKKRTIQFYCWHSQRHTDENGAEANKILLSEQVTTENVDSITGEADLVSHGDGTYSLPCNITIVPDIDKHDGAEICLTIKHNALAKPIQQKRLLSVVGRGPKVSEIMKPLRIIHQESITLMCPINGFKPRPLKLTWIKKNHSKEEKLVECGPGKDEVNYFSQKYLLTTSESAFEDGTFSILSALSFAPSITADNEAEFLCKIHHCATKKEDEKKLMLYVKAQPTLDPIQAVPETPCTEDQCTLSCRIHSFFPQTLKVHWYKNDDEVLENITISDVSIGPGGLCSCTTIIEFTPCIKDIGKAFKCRVSHESLKDHKSFGKINEATWMLNLISSPKSLEILCEPREPIEGENVTLSCVVKDYYPPECEVRWFKGFQPIEPAIVEAPQLCEETELYRRKSKLTFTPTKDDHNAEFSLEVIHHGRQLRRMHHLILKDFPIVQNIEVVPQEVMYGKPVTLSCQVMGCDPNDLTITWFQKSDQIRNGFSSRPPQNNIKDNTIRYFDLKLIPTALHYNQEFVCKVKHKNLPQSINKQIYLPLKPQPPLLSDITITTAEPDVTKTLRMCINVSNFAPKEIHIKWYNSWMEFPKEMVTCSEPQIGNRFLYCASSQIEFKPESRDRDIKIRCEVTHSSTNTVLEKIQHFNFKGWSTNIDKKNTEYSHTQKKNSPRRGCEAEIQKEEQPSEIQCLTSDPKAGETVVLKYFIAGCSTRSADVSWFDGMYPIDEDCIQNLDNKDKSGCISTVTFPTDSENKGRECEIRCEVTKDYETIEKTYILKLT